ncbi:MAG: TIGR01177 family methyltransferase [Halobacteriales archaeon]
MYALELAGEDDAFAAAEVRAAASAVSVVAPGLAVARGVDHARFRGLAYSGVASDLIARSGADLDAARAALDAATVDREGTVAVRGRDVRGTASVSTQATERELGAVLVERGFAVDLDDPDHELRALFSEDVCLLGWRAVESVRDFGSRAPTDKPFFTPGSMEPRLARATANLALGSADPRTATVLDPMCGTGGGLVEAGLLGTDVVGVDAQREMVGGARRNLSRYLDSGGVAGLPAPGSWHLARGDATHIPLADGLVDAAVFDVPYGRQSRIEGDGTDELAAAALAEARRVADRAVVVADRPLADPARETGWTVENVFRRRVHRSLVRHVHVLG